MPISSSRPAPCRSPAGMATPSMDCSISRPSPVGADRPCIASRTAGLLAMHGGPSSHASVAFQPLFQFLLTRGIAVFDLDYRGSTGYGRHFTQLDDGGRRMDAVRDMAGAMDWLARNRLADTSRAAVYGASYGGFMAFAALAMLPGRFKAGVGIAGVSNWITALATASPMLKATDRVEYGNVDDSTDRQ